MVILAAQEDLGEKLREFSGQKFEMAIVASDAKDMEVWGLKAAIAGTLSPASFWEELPEHETGAWTDGIKVFVSAAAPDRTKRAAKRLAALLDETLGKRTIGKLSVGSVGLGIIDPTNESMASALPSSVDVITILVGSHI